MDTCNQELLYSYIGLSLILTREVVYMEMPINRTRVNLGLMFFCVRLKVLMRGLIHFLREKTSVLRVIIVPLQHFLITKPCIMWTAEKSKLLR
jgi:hypothetical protein